MPLAPSMIFVDSRPEIHAPVIVVTPAPEPYPAYDASKRVIDVIVALILLVLLLPVVVIASALIVLTMRQSPLLRQVRTGYLGREFRMFKLRTMYQGTDETMYPQSSRGVLLDKGRDDVRVSWVGHFLRRSSIDEVPQLVNVLMDQMSLVGPRPGLPFEVARYPASWRRRLTVKPGLTGLWQVSGRSEVEPRRRTAMDRYYIRRRSLAFDWAILARTVAAVVLMRGAW